LFNNEFNKKFFSFLDSFILSLLNVSLSLYTLSICCFNVSKVFSSFSGEFTDLFFGNFGVDKLSFISSDEKDNWGFIF
jgi:uncharacterized membrane protein